MAMAAMNMVSAEGFCGVSFHLRCTRRVASVENLHFWFLTIKVRPPDGTIACLLLYVTVDCLKIKVVKGSDLR